MIGHIEINGPNQWIMPPDPDEDEDIYGDYIDECANEICSKILEELGQEIFELEQEFRVKKIN